MSDGDYSSGPIDVATLEVLARCADTHPLVDSSVFRPDVMSPRRLELHLDDGQYPTSVEDARLDVRWFEGGDYTVHYLEIRGTDVWQCRWDRHPKPGEPKAHFHPSPDAAPTVEPSGLRATHHLDVLFAALDRTAERIGHLHD